MAIPFIAIALACTWLFRTWPRERQLASWRQVARSHRLTFQPPTDDGAGVIEGEHEGVHFHIDSVKGAHMGIATRFTRVMAEWPAALLPRFVIVSRTAPPPQVAPDLQASPSGQAKLDGSFVFFVERGKSIASVLNQNGLQKLNLFSWFLICDCDGRRMTFLWPGLTAPAELLAAPIAIAVAAFRSARSVYR
jgi:hypothetical protein